MELDPDRQRALAILRGHAWATVSFQLLEAEFSYWFDGDDAFVAYVDTGAAWVAGGAPVAPASRLAAVARGFTEAAEAAGRRVCFFGCEQRFVDASGLPSLMLGEQPVWSPAGWDARLAELPSLRAQLRRARNKGVTTRIVTDIVDPLRTQIVELAAHWLATRRMAPMGFLVQLEPLRAAHERVLIVAEQTTASGTELVGFLSAVPVYARRRLFVEDLCRERRAPNGTVELMIDAAMRAAAARGDDGVTLGLAPLAGAVPPVLRLARTLTSPLYDFRGIHAFKAKLRPEHWEPVYLCARRPWLALHDGLAAFARGDLVGFGVATLAHRPRVALALGVLAAAAAAMLLAT